MLDKIGKYIPLIILIGVVIIIWLLWDNKKNNNGQSALLMEMAKMLRDKSESKSENLKETVKQIEEEQDREESEESYQETEEDGQEIVRIAEKIYFNQELTEEEQDFRLIHLSEINEEIEYCKVFYSLVDKFVSGERNFTDQEQAFYEANEEAIQDAVADKMQSMANEAIEHHRNPQSNESDNDDLKGAKPPMAKSDRAKVILSLFEDGIPKRNMEIAQLYSEKTKTKLNKGNISTTIGKLEDEKKLIPQTIKGYVYYCLPEWFDGRKLKSEYKNTIH